MLSSLSNKTLFITGASRGIGLAIGLRAARDGANVAIAAKTLRSRILGTCGHDPFGREGEIEAAARAGRCL